MYASRRRKIVWLSPSTMSVSATYRVVRKSGSLSKESMMESDGGNDRDGAVGRPSLRAVAVSTRWPRVVSCAPGGLAVAAVSRTTRRAAGAGGGGGGGGGGGFCAGSDPTPRRSRTSVAAAIRRARRRLAIQAHQMLSS